MRFEAAGCAAVLYWYSGGSGTVWGKRGMLEQFSRFGRELFLQGINSSHSGNMSERVGVPVIRAGLTVGSDEVAEKLLPLLENYKAAMVRGYGSLAVGQMLEGAFQWTSRLEASCKTLYLYRLLSPGDKEEGIGKW